MYKLFESDESSHAHSLETLEILYDYDDFMESVGTVCDMGSGAGHDSLWWATRETRDDLSIPLNIKCTSIDIASKPIIKHANIKHITTDFEKLNCKDNQFDLIWSHNSFQYATNPIATLAEWYRVAATNAMLVIILPQTTNTQYNQIKFEQPDGNYYHHTLVSMMHMLALNGWDCASGFFSKKRNNIWIKLIVYKSEHRPMDPKTTSWYTLSEKGLLPISAIDSINHWGYLRQHDLFLPWVDKSWELFDKH